MYVFLCKRLEEPEAEKIRLFADEVKQRDRAARIDLNEGDGFICCFIYSRAVAGYLTNAFIPELRLHTIGNNDDYFEIPLSCVNTLYEL